MDLIVKFILSGFLLVFSNLVFAEDYYCDDSVIVYVNANEVLSGMQTTYMFHDSKDDLDVKISIDESSVRVLTSGVSSLKKDTNYDLEIEDETNDGDVFVATETSKKYLNGRGFVTLNFNRGEYARFVLTDITGGARGKILYGQCSTVKPKSKNNGIW